MNFFIYFFKKRTTVKIYNRSNLIYNGKYSFYEY